MSETILEYVKNEMRTFEEFPFREADSLVLSQFAYIHLGNLVQPPAKKRVRKPLCLQQLYRAECFPHFFANQPDADKNRELLCACAASPRFRDVGIAYYQEDFDPKSEKQFCAMTFFLNKTQCYLAFRGTDSTLVGWKEDFNMAVRTPVPAQEEASAYLETIAGFTDASLLLGGHSKGGNLAVYAALESSDDILARITDIYSHDGPGFRGDFLAQCPYDRIRSKLHKTIPQASLVGMLFEDAADYAIVESTAQGIVQHNPYTWSIQDGQFVPLTALTTGAEFLNNTLGDWLAALDDEKREQFVEALYIALSSTDRNSFLELRENWPEDLPGLIGSAKTWDESTRQILRETMRTLMRMAVKNLPAPGSKERHLKKA